MVNNQVDVQPGPADAPGADQVDREPLAQPVLEHEGIAGAGRTYDRSCAYAAPRPLLLARKKTPRLLRLPTMDTLSGVLKSIRLEGAVFLDAEFTAPWCMRGRYGMTSVKQLLAGAEHVVLFHFLTAGACRVRLAEGGEAIEVRAGDLILFAQDDRHLMGSDLHLAPLEADNLIDAATAVAADPAFVPIRHGGGGAATRFVCGYLACSRSLCRPLFEALPRVLRIELGDGPTAGLVRELLRVGVRESSESRPGAQSTLAKLAELMFVEALRRHVETLPAEGHGWLAALRDVQIGRALALLHSKGNGNQDEKNIIVCDSWIDWSLRCTCLQGHG